MATPKLELVPSEQAGQFDSEVRQFMTRLMAGYETMSRRMADHADMLAEQVRTAQLAASRSLELQLQLQSEREDLISRRHERELMAQAAAQKSEAMHSLLADLKALAPLAVKKALGAPLTGSDSHGLQDFLSSLTPAQVEGVLGDGSITLTPGQRMLMAEVFMSLSGSAESANSKEESDQ